MAGCVFTQLFNRRHTPPIAVWNRLCQPSTEVASAFFSGGSRYPARADPEYFRNGSGPDGFRCIAPPGASIPESADSLAHLSPRHKGECWKNAFQSPNQDGGSRGRSPSRRSRGDRTRCYGVAKADFLMRRMSAGSSFVKAKHLEPRSLSDAPMR